MRKLFVALTAACVAAIVLAAPAQADTPIATPKLQINSAYPDGSRLSAAVFEHKDGLPTYLPYIAEQASGRPIGIQYAYPESVGEYENYGFNTVEKLVVGTTYYVSLRVKTVGFWLCSIYDPDGCSFIDPTDYTYQWTFVYSGATLMDATPYYSPVTSTAVLEKNSWDKGKKKAKLDATVDIDHSCLCARSVVVKGLYNGNWIHLQSLTSNYDLVDLNLPVAYKYKKVRVQVKPVTVNKSDGGQVTYSKAVSNTIKTPKKPS